MPGNALNGLLQTLAGAKRETHESVRFEADKMREALEHIRRLQGTGALTIHFSNGKANGMVEWKTKQ